MTEVDERVSPRTEAEAVEKALLYMFQLSGKDYRKMQTALSEVAFIRALEQDGYTVAPLNAIAAREADLAAALRAEHDQVCACPFDGTDPGCNFTDAGEWALRLIRGEAGTE